MKKLLCLLGVTLFFSSMGYGQSVRGDGKDAEIKELKEHIEKYCVVVIYGKSQSGISNQFVAKVETDIELLSFVNKETGNNLEFINITGLLNFMSKSGWRYVNATPTIAQQALMVRPGIIFEKIEK